MKSDNAINYVLIIFCFVLMLFVVVGSKVADNILAKQSQFDNSSFVQAKTK